MGGNKISDTDSQFLQRGRGVWPLLSCQTIPYLAIICHADLTRSQTLKLPSYQQHYRFASKQSIQCSTNAWNTKKHNIDNKQTICKVMNIAQTSFQLLRWPLFVCVVAADKVGEWVLSLWLMFQCMHTSGPNILLLLNLCEWCMSRNAKLWFLEDC